MKRQYLTDKEVMSVLMISRKTLASAIRGGKGVCGINLKAAEPIIVSAGKKRGERRWPVSKFSAVTGLSRKEIEDSIS